MAKLIKYLIVVLLMVGFTPEVESANKLEVNDEPGAAGEWGFRPAEDKAVQVTPPGFVWRPQKEAMSYQLQVSREEDFSEIQYEAANVKYNVHTPSRTLPAGRWYWRFRFEDAMGTASAWSRVRSFTTGEDVNELPLPAKKELIERIPKTHPRLFVRPEQIPELKRRAQGDLKERFEELAVECERLLQNPPATKEPPRYPEDMERKSEEWRKMWWGNRVYTVRALNGAATLAFTRLLGGKEEYGELAKKILMECAGWNPKGSTGYRYNDEAGMPYNYYFSRTYTFVYDLLSAEERGKCREVMKVRGEEMYRHLCPRHLWRPYSSHSNRAWHFLGEVGIAFLHEIPEAEEWAWFAANVFANVYPVWNDDDGGWHEGMAYWRSYIRRFTWWTDIMRAAMDIDAFHKPYFSQVGYYPMYLQPPGTRGGGFGDLTARLDSRGNRGLMAIFAPQAQNPYWQWYVDAHGGAPAERGYIGFIRGALPQVSSKPPDGLPSSRCFWGVGQAMLNTDITDARDNVQIIFKSSPFGTQSHGYESQNSFLLYAFGERLFIRTGRRDIYGSKHHKQWMWQTKSTNCITVNGESQVGHSANARGKILDFHSGPVFDYVSGEAAEAYAENVKRFTRRILFIKPEAIVIFDTLQTAQPSTFEWLLHSPAEMDIRSQNDIRAVNGGAACRVNFLWPKNLDLNQTDKFDPPPRPRVKLVEYHLTAKRVKPTKLISFITLLQPHRTGKDIGGEVKFNTLSGAFIANIPLKAGHAIVLMQPEGTQVLSAYGLETKGELAAGVFDENGELKHKYVN